MYSRSRTITASPGTPSSTTVRPRARPEHSGPPSLWQSFAMASNVPLTLYTPTPCLPIGTNLCEPGGISSTVATTCSRPCASRGGFVSSATTLDPRVAALLPAASEHPNLALEGRHRVRQMIGRDAVAEHH